tara:strand:+ start:419 stop:550 length:132 start_codon:yes stop_codon:yes gene_type:complete
MWGNISFIKHGLYIMHGVKGNVNPYITMVEAPTFIEFGFNFKF